MSNTRKNPGTTMICPKCGGGVNCTDSRAGTRNSVRRRRRCLESNCGFRFTTYETQLPETPLPASAVLFLVGEVETAIAGVHAALGKLKGGLEAAQLVEELKQ